VPALNARLARERDILAQLTHPNIARLYDAGTDERGRPFLALEYVEGVPIDEYLQRHPLDLRGQLALFKQVASAVAYAHRHLVVHRDLKPSNVLVSEDGVAHLLDFGIAKMLSDESEGATQITRAAGRMLTPGYASPEQIRGEHITVASDVYSLGVLLYEMLTRTRPFHATGASLTELEAAAAAGLAPLASSRVSAKMTQRALRGDLDTILAKALRKEPDARYRTVDALIDDLDRHLNGEPVLARPDSGWYRASRFISRHRKYVASASVALLSVLVGMGIAIDQAHRAGEEARRAQIQAERAEAVRDFVIGLFDLNHGDDPNRMELRQFPAHELVERGVRRIAKRYDAQPALRAEMLGIAGLIFADIGDPKNAAEMAHGQLAALDPSPSNWRERAEAMRVLARAQIQEMHNDLAEETLGKAIGEVGERHGEEAASLHSMLAGVQFVRARFAASSESLDRAERLLDAEGDRKSLVYADVLRNRSYLLLWDRRDPTAARAMFDRARQLTESLTGPLSAESIALKRAFARHLIHYGETDAGKALIDELVAHLRQASGNDDLEAAALELDMIARLNDLRLLPDQGISRLEQVMNDLIRRRSDVPELLRARADMTVGAAYTERGDIQLAEPLLKHAYQQLGNTPPSADVSPVFADKYNAMGFYAQWADEAGQHEVATALWDEIYRARGAALTTTGVRRDSVIDSEVNAIRSRIMRGDLASANERLVNVKRQLGTGRPRIASIHWDPRLEALTLEVLLDIEGGKLTNARHLVDEWLRARTSEHAQDMLVYTLWPAGMQALQAVVQCRTGQAAAGLDQLTNLIGTYQERLAPSNPTMAYLRSHAGLCAVEANRLDRAQELQAAARRAFTAQPAVSAFYKKPLMELERKLSGRQIAGD
jgi:hypothetical protein